MKAIGVFLRFFSAALLMGLIIAVPAAWPAQGESAVKIQGRLVYQDGPPAGGVSLVLWYVVKGRPQASIKDGKWVNPTAVTEPGGEFTLALAKDLFPEAESYDLMAAGDRPQPLHKQDGQRLRFEVGEYTKEMDLGTVILPVPAPEKQEAATGAGSGPDKTVPIPKITIPDIPKIPPLALPPPLPPIEPILPPNHQPPPAPAQLPGISAADPGNQLKFINKSGKDALVRVCRQDNGALVCQVTAPKGETKGTAIQSGRYFILVRFCDADGRETYAQGDPFAVLPPPGKRSIVSITLHPVKGGQYHLKKINKGDFEK